MKRAPLLSWFGVLSVVAVLFNSCETTKSGGMTGGMKPPFGGPVDVTHAAGLWSRMSGYQSWQSYPDKGGWQEGRSPHGAWLKYYIDSTAARNPENPGYGSIIVKENYMTKDGMIAAITVMEKRRGYDPDNGDWFWVKFKADGSLHTNDKGMKLAGRVAKGMPKGCIACHGNAAGDDYLFINDG